jgi:hypothetical protein
VHALIAKSCAQHAPFKAMGTRTFLGMHKTDKAPFPLKVQARAGGMCFLGVVVVELSEF